MLQTEKARIEDLEIIMSVIDAARNIMQQNGNTQQWVKGYPDIETIKQDIANENGLVIVDENEEIVAYYAFIRNQLDPTYQTIKDGHWLDSDTDELGLCSYSVIHRIASLPNVHGIFDEIMRHCSVFTGNIRIDTHRDNHIMQHILEKHGFVYCGIIFTERGDERLAYQRMEEYSKSDDEYWEKHNAASAWEFAQTLKRWNSMTIEEKEQDVIEKERQEHIYGRFWEDWSDDECDEADYHPGQKEYEIEFDSIRKRLKKQGRLKFY